MITAVLNCYKRPEYLQEQIEAIKNQTVPVDDILIWSNRPEEGQQYNLDSLGVKVAYANTNFKFHARFAYGLLARTKYLAYFDDDTIPGPKWFESCLNTIEQGYNGILGTTGVVLTGDNYDTHYKVGWNGRKSDQVTEVDLVGHAWFFEKKFLHYLWIEEPISWDNGEDMQLSYFAQKHGGIKTYVPPHPPNQLDVYGSIPEKGMKYGLDSKGNSVAKFDNHKNLRNEIASTLMSKGWKLADNDNSR